MGCPSQTKKLDYKISQAGTPTESPFSNEVLNDGLGFLDPFNPELDRASSDYDARHRFP